MNEPTLIVRDARSSAMEPTDARLMPARSAEPATPAMLLQMAVSQGADLDRLERLMALQERWEAAEARKAYNEAFAAFKATAVRIVKNRAVDSGPLSGKKYAELFSVVNAVTPALSANGLSAAWKLTKDDPTWIEVTCTLRHIAGHSESVSMGGAPDTGGAKNPIQARASTVSYLERYTLKAITGLSEQGDDTDATADAECIGPGQCADLEAMIDEVKADRGRFLRYFKLESLDQLPLARFAAAIAMLNEKRKG